MEIKNILVIRFRRVGDSVLAMALCHSLKQSFPKARIDFVLNENITSLYQEHPDVDRLIAFTNEENKKPLKYIGKVWNVMRETKYDVIIDMRSTIRTLFFSLFALSVPYRIGTRKSYNVLLHNFRIDNHKEESTDMVKSNLMLMQPLEKEAKLVSDESFKLYITEAEKGNFRSYMEKQGIDFNRPTVLATVTARLAHKVWDKERMKEVLHRMITQYDTQIIFNFAGNEKEFAEMIYHEMGNDKHLFINIEANSLRELSALTANCDFFFGNEGGPRHISQAFGIPSYAIYPPGIAKSVWLPGNSQRYCGISPDDVLPIEQQQSLDYLERFNLITVENVWKELNTMLTDYLKK